MTNFDLPWEFKAVLTLENQSVEFSALTEYYDLHRGKKDRRKFNISSR